MYSLVTLTIALLLTACTPQPHAKVAEVLQIIHDNYVTETNQTQLNDTAIHAIVQRLDPHTTYLDRKQLERFLVATTGSFGGVGIYMHLQDRLLTVVAPIAHSPAEAAGIQRGDVILQIDGHPTLGLTIEEAIALTKGRVGTPLHLTILRRSLSKPLHFSIRRAHINPKPLFATVIKKDILYISIATFNAQTSQALARILQEHREDTQSIILDLRYNPGGVLRQALNVVDMFIDGGLIVKQKGHTQKYDDTYYASSSTIAPKKSMAILINGGTASAAEIVSGTLQIYKRATLIGERSYGKGSVQTLFWLDDHSALKMTIAKYYLANGRCIDQIGIQPDVVVTNPTYHPHHTPTISYTYAQTMLKRLTTHTIKPIEATTLPHRPKKRSLTPQEIARDKQLQKAIAIVKAKATAKNSN